MQRLVFLRQTQCMLCKLVSARRGRRRCAGSSWQTGPVTPPAAFGAGGAVRAVAQCVAFPAAAPLTSRKTSFSEAALREIKGKMGQDPPTDYLV